MEKFIVNTIKLANYYKSLGEGTFAQLSEEQLLWKPSPTDNSIAIIVNHMSGNMLSRWTNFLEEDGEKTWRNRESEFDDFITSRGQLLDRWAEGWSCFLDALSSLSSADLDRIVYIRNEGHTVTDAIQRQIAHYPYHVGQIVLMGKIILGSHWKSLSIPRYGSDSYNQQKFNEDKEQKHFTDRV